MKGRPVHERREVIPIHDITLTFRNKNLCRFTLVPDDKSLRAKTTQDGLQAIVPQLDVRCMVVAE